MREQTEQLAAYCRERLDGGLRSVGYHTADGHEVVYVRDDLEPTYVDDRVARYLDASRDISAALRRLESLGGPEFSVHGLESALLCQFHGGEGRVVFLSLEPDVGRNLGRFVEDCRGVLA